MTEFPVAQRERVVARRLRLAIPDPMAAQTEENQRPSLYIDDEAHDYLQAVIARTKTAWERTNENRQRDIIMNNASLFRFLRQWLLELSNGQPPVVVLSNIEQNEPDAYKYELLSLLFGGALEELSKHAILVFPQWPPQTWEVLDEDQ